LDIFKRAAFKAEGRRTVKRSRFAYIRVWFSKKGFIGRFDQNRAGSLTSSFSGSCGSNQLNDSVIGLFSPRLPT
jgi:hypothetical protein